MLALILFALIVTLYVTVSAIYPMHLRWRWKALLIILVVLGAFKFHWLFLLGGDMFYSPVVSGMLLVISAWMFSVLFLYLFILLGADVIRLGYLGVLKCCSIPKPANFRIWRNRTNLILLIFGAGLTTFGMLEGTAIPQIKEQIVAVPHLPQQAEGFTIAVLADLHVDGFTDKTRIEQMVERTNALNPDVVLIAGDFVDGPVHMYGKDLQPLADLKAKYGVFGVLGNHDYYSGAQEWIEFLTGLGIRILQNEHELIVPHAVAIAGVTDPMAKALGGPAPDVAQALACVPQGYFKVLAAHQPILVQQSKESGTDLQISGHTHGGMMYGMNKVVAWLNKGFVSGLYELDHMQLYVSNGSGIWNGFPVRIGVPSEITLIRLQKNNAK